MGGVFLFPGPMQRRSLHIVIFSGLFGVLAWVSVTMREDYETTVSSPLLLQDIPAGMAVQTPLPRTLQLRFRGEGWRLAGVLLGHNPGVVFPASSLPAGHRPLTFNDFADHISLAPGVRLLDVKPDSLRIELGPAVRKRVPVALDCLASFREGYGQVGPTSVEPDSVTLTGAESCSAGSMRGRPSGGCSRTSGGPLTPRSRWPPHHPMRSPFPSRPSASRFPLNLLPKKSFPGSRYR